MLKFEGRNVHAPSLPKDTVKQTPNKGGFKSKNKQKVDTKKPAQQTHQKNSNQITSRGKNNSSTTASGDKKHINPAARKRHAISRETVVLTKSQLQEILSAAKLTHGKDKEDHNLIFEYAEDNIYNTNVNAKQDDTKRTEGIYPVSPVEIQTIPTPTYKDDNNNTKRNEEIEDLKTHPEDNNSMSTQLSDHKMSLVEQKRLQWAKERAQMQGEMDWNPWGRPGGGAPAVSRNSISEWNSYRRPNTNPAQTVKTNIDNVRTVLPPLPLTAPSSKKPIPPALRSSIGFGQVGLTNDCSYVLAKEEEKKKWLEELDRQREEQRLRKIMELDTYQNMQLEKNHHIIDSPSKITSPMVPKTPTSPAQYSQSLPTVVETGNNNYFGGMDEAASNKSYLRGANVPMDIETRLEMEKKRQKQKEQQLAIQTQLEEKHRRKLQEKERQRLEELKEEERIIKECELLAHQKYLEEQQVKEKRKSHQENEENEEEIQQIEKKLETKQSNMNNEVDSINDNNTAEKPSTQEEISPAAKVLPVLVSSIKTPYIENRLLTPTKYRDSDQYVFPPRDCGTQTDPSFPRKKDVATDVDNKLSKEIGKKSQASDKKSSKSEGKTQRKDGEQNERPKWGVNQSEKVYKKQSEKDINYCQRKHLQEMRQKRLQYEAAIQNDQPQIGRTRSSAKLQRHLLARETCSPEIHSSARDSERIVHQSSIESPLTDEFTGDNIVRKPRRQWASPSTDEIPNFYTQPHQLPARRNSRSQSSNSMALNTPEGVNNIKYDRDIIPSAPQLRGMQTLSSWNSSSDLRSASPTLRATKSSTHSLENVRLLKGSDDNNKMPIERLITSHSELHNSNNYMNAMDRTETIMTQGSDTLRDSLDFNYIPYLRSSVTLDRQTTAESNSRNDSRSDKNRILQQLSAIRQGLIMKQQELNKLLNPNESTLNSTFD